MTAENTGLYVCLASWCIPMLIAFTMGIFAREIWNRRKAGSGRREGRKLFGGRDDDA